MWRETYGAVDGAAANALLNPAPLMSQHSMGEAPTDKEASRARIEAIVDQMRREQLTINKLTVTMNSIKHKRDVRELKQADCPFELMRKARDMIVEMSDDDAGKQAQIVQYNAIYTLFEGARESIELRAGLLQIFNALDFYKDTKETKVREYEKYAACVALYNEKDQEKQLAEFYKRSAAREEQLQELLLPTGKRALTKADAIEANKQQKSE